MAVRKAAVNSGPKPGNMYASVPWDEAQRLKTGRRSGENIQTNLGRIGLDPKSIRDRTRRAAGGEP